MVRLKVDARMSLFLFQIPNLPKFDGVFVDTEAGTVTVRWESADAAEQIYAARLAAANNRALMLKWAREYPGEGSLESRADKWAYWLRHAFVFAKDAGSAQ
jgi:hypothetical protein